MEFKKFEKTENDKKILISINGDLEITTLKPFEAEIIEIGENATKDIELDFTSVDYIDSSGIAIMIKLSQILKSKRKKLKMVNLSEKIQQILELSSLVDDLEENKIEIA